MSIRKGNDIIASKPLVDAVPTQDSTNAVSSGGVYDVIQKITRGGFYHPDMFDFKWADHEVNDVQWLRADTFSWQSGSVYEAAFNDLFNDIYISTSWRATGYANVYTASPTPEAGDTVYSDSACTTSVGTVTSYDSVNNQMEYNSVTWDYNSNGYVTPVSETVAGYSVDVYTGHSGKKIVSWQDESDVASIYSATGVAWYYIIDIPNKRFKLPRTQYGVTGLRDTVGNYVAESLPNITGSFGVGPYTETTSVALGTLYADGAFAAGSSVNAPNHVQGAGGYATRARGSTFDASRSSSAYQDSAPVQQRATQMYLYFYVGEFTQTALENTAGIRAEDLNNKVDVGHQVIAFQEPTALNNYTWYRKYADGWVEQGGVFDTGGDRTASAPWVITLPVVMDSVNYTGIASMGGRTSGGGYGSYCVVPDSERTTTTLYVYAFKTETAYRYINWRVCGIAA